MLSCLLGAACAEAPAVRSRWNFHPRWNVVQTAVETIHETATLILQHLRLHFNEDLRYELDQPQLRYLLTPRDLHCDLDETSR